MGKVITVWGSPGSGKSMFSCILAKALTRDKRKTIIINAEISVPMLPVWLPEQIIQTNASVGQVLSSVEIDTTLVASHVTVLKSYPFIGLMGYSAGENPLSYPEVKYAKLKRNKLQRALDIAGLELTPEIYTARAWVTAGAVGLCSTGRYFFLNSLSRYAHVYICEKCWMDEALREIDRQPIPLRIWSAALPLVLGEAPPSSVAPAEDPQI